MQRSSRGRTMAAALCSDHFKSKEIFLKAVRTEPGSLECVPDRLKTQEMCDKAVEKDFVRICS